MTDPSPRLTELGARQLAGTITPAELAELEQLRTGNEPAPPKRKRGRPTVYSNALAERLCDRIAAGASLREAAQAENITHSTALDWLDRFPRFSDQYTRAREKQTQLLEDRLIELCHEGHEAAKDRRANRARMAAIRHESDIVRWRLARLLPKKYGTQQRMELTGAEGAPLVPVPDPAILASLAEMEAAAAARIRAASPEGGGSP